MKKSFIDKVLDLRSVDTRKYRYILREGGRYPYEWYEIARLPLAALGTTAAIDGWTVVWRSWEPLTERYIMTHTPREIADNYTLEDIDSFVRHIAPVLDDVDIFGPCSVTEGADEVTSLENCRYLVAEWWEREIEEGKPHPTARQLAYAYQILVAKALREELES
jgi:hypothetical protein